MKYPDGIDIRLGDRIWWDEGVALGYVWMPDRWRGPAVTPADVTGFQR